MYIYNFKIQNITIHSKKEFIIIVYILFIFLFYDISYADNQHENNNLFNISKIVYYMQDLNLSNEVILANPDESLIGNCKFWFKEIYNENILKDIDYSKFKFYRKALNKFDIVYYSNNSIEIVITSNSIITIISKINISKNTIFNFIGEYININDYKVDDRYLKCTNEILHYYNNMNNQLSWKDLIHIVYYKDSIYINIPKYDHYLHYTTIGDMKNDWF